MQMCHREAWQWRRGSQRGRFDQTFFPPLSNSGPFSILSVLGCPHLASDDGLNEDCLRDRSLHSRTTPRDGRKRHLISLKTHGTELFVWTGRKHIKWITITHNKKLGACIYIFKTEMRQLDMNSPLSKYTIWTIDCFQSERPEFLTLATICTSKMHLACCQMCLKCAPDLVLNYWWVNEAIYVRE